MALEDSVVRICRSNDRGSGILVGADLVLTAGHVVYPSGQAAPRCTDLSVSHPDSGQEWEVLTIWVDPRWRRDDPAGDVALLRVRPPNGAPVAVVDSFSAGSLTRQGLPVDADDPLGASARGAAEVSGGIIYSGDDDMQIPHGASGGPLVTDQGLVAGVGMGQGARGPLGFPIGAAVSTATLDLVHDPGALVDQA